LNIILETEFSHVIDAPSLSLLIPIADYGLMAHDNESKKKASGLIGHICSLTSDPTDLLPYMDIIKPAIMNSLFDSLPDVRQTSAKAMGALSKGLGMEESLNLIQWLGEKLNDKKSAPTERSGAAHGYAEIMSSHGDRFLMDKFKDLIELVRDPKAHIRESYFTVFVYLPTTVDNFERYFGLLMPVFLDGLADDNDDV
jgi:hypothetical protein